MPVKFKGCSDYVKNYKWNSSFRSATFEPKFQQIKRDAGLRSDQIFASQEPGFTSKKQAWHREPQVQSCLMWWPEDDNDLSNMQSDSSLPKQTVQEAEKPLEDRVVKRKTTPKAVKEQIVREVPLTSSEHKNIGVQISPCKKNVTTTTPSAYKKNKFSQTPPKPSYYNVTQKRNSSTNDNKKESPVKAKSPKKIQDNMQLKVYKPENDIILKRKAGIAKPRNVLNRQSEYQRMYSPPRQVIKSSPLLSALDIIHSSSVAVAPPLRTKPVYRTTSEYNAKYCREFKSPQHASNEKVYSPPSPSMKRKVKNMQNPQKLAFPHAPKIAQSEYNREFVMKEDEGIEKKQQIAEQNKQRHEGSHIDPEHLMQVPSKTNNMWDMSSQGSEIPLRSDVANKEEENKEDYCSTESIADNDSAYKNELSIEPFKPKIAWSDVTDSAATPSQNGENESARTEEIKVDLESRDAETTASILEGRVTTPRLNEMNGALRTHHDLTTPCKGGALLVSPPSIADSCGSYIPTTRTPTHKNSPREKNSMEKLAPTIPKTAGVRTADFIPLVSERKVALTKRLPEYNLDKDQPKVIHTSPVRTPKTRSTQTRMNATSPEVRIPTRGVGKKNTKKEFTNKENQQPKKSPCPPIKAKTLRAPIRGSLNAVEFQHCGPGPKTMPLDISFLQNADNQIDNISIASSRVSERTQDLLDKAKSRKNFWSTK